MSTSGWADFFRAHQAWYTEHSPDRSGLGHRGVHRPSARPWPRPLTASGRPVHPRPPGAADDDRFAVISSVSGSTSWGGGPRQLVLVRILVFSRRPDGSRFTVTEAGYLRGGDGGLDTGDPAVAGGPGRAAVSTRQAPCCTHARLAWPPAWPARRRGWRLPADRPCSCDNLPGQRPRRRAGSSPVLLGLLDPSLEVVDHSGQVRVVTTVADRITPQLTGEDSRRWWLRPRTGITRTRAPVVTEPFSEWVLSGTINGWAACRLGRGGRHLHRGHHVRLSSASSGS